jgi:hypothetical protein
MQRVVCYHRLMIRMTGASPWIAKLIRRTALIALLAPACLAQSDSISSPPTAPGELVRKAVDNEIKASQDPNARFMFRSTRTKSGAAVTKIFVQAKEATAGVVVAYNGTPLTPAQRQDERARIERFTKSPDEMEKKRRQEQVDADRTMRIIRALPDAFIYEYDGEKLGSPGVGRSGEPLVALKFRPNPRYDPPSRVEQILTGMRGTLLLDAHRSRLASIDGTLYKDVGFGWGILGHLDQGGHFLVQQQEIGNNYWVISRTNVDVTGKILLFKGFSFSLNEVFSDFKPVPKDIPFAQAIELLEKEESLFTEAASAGTRNSSAR